MLRRVVRYIAKGKLSYEFFEKRTKFCTNHTTGLKIEKREEFCLA